MVDVIDELKARYSNRKTQALEKVVRRSFETARQEMENNNLEDGLSILEDLLNTGMDHARQAASEAGIEDVEHEKIEKYRERIEGVRDSGDLDKGLELVDDMERWVVKRWNNG